MIFFPNCKINLGLHITRKRPDGFHDLQTLFYPLPITDALEIITNLKGEKEVALTLSGTSIDASSDNICVRAYQLLKKDFTQLPPVTMHLHKTIPVGAGLGGGSADGAFTLLLLNKKYNLGLTQQQLLQYALQLGSDCPFFIINKPCLGSGRGEDLAEVDIHLSNYKVVVVNPGIHINTGWAFSQLQPKEPELPLADIIKKDVSEWKHFMVNDFEAPIFSHHPQVKEIKDELYRTGAVYASMSGSGSTVFGLFEKPAPTSYAFPATYYVKECYL